MEAREIVFDYVNRDVNGNPRGVLHYMEFLTDKEQQTLDVERGMAIAHKRANKLGFSKYRAKSHGGCFVCQTWHERTIIKKINEMLLEVEAKEEQL